MTLSEKQADMLKRNRIKARKNGLRHDRGRPRKSGWRLLR